LCEVDGDIHDLQQEEDARREKVLSAVGLKIVRFRNDDVMRELSPSPRLGDASPALPQGLARLRATVTAIHITSEIERAMNVIGKAREKTWLDQTYKTPQRRRFFKKSRNESDSIWKNIYNIFLINSI